MYMTPIYTPASGKAAEGNFDWESFFAAEEPREGKHPVHGNVDGNTLLLKARKHLEESKFRLAFSLNRMMKQLLGGREPQNPRILELGAATGFLTRWLIEHYGGTGVLVDAGEASYQAYSRLDDPVKRHIRYVKGDLFRLESDGLLPDPASFDLVCSFGLIEHFKDKGPVLEVHRRFTAPGGIMVILVPRDTPLSRAFFEIHPELNLGYRELLKEKELKKILEQQGLNILGLASSRDYSYDFTGALCVAG